MNHVLRTARSWSIVACLSLFACGGGNGSQHDASDAPLGSGGVPADGAAAGNGGMAGTTDAGPDGKPDAGNDAGLGGAAGSGSHADAAGDGGVDGPSDSSDGAAGNGIAGSVITLPIAARAMVYDGTRNLLYATVPGDAALYPNTVVSVDPTSGTVVSALPVGSDPGPLTLSDDASTLWVGLIGASGFRKIILPAGSSPAMVGPVEHFPAAMFSFLTPLSMVAVPGQPGTIAVAMSAGGAPAADAVFDDGVERTNVISLNGAGSSRLYAGPPGYLFGFGSSQGAQAALAVMSITPTGFTQTLFQGLLSGGGSGVYNKGILYADGGEVVDVSNPAAPVRIGQFAFSGPIALRSDQYLLMLTHSNGAGTPTSQLRILETNHDTQVTALPLPSSLTTLTSSLFNLVYAGDDAAAFLSSDISAINPVSKLVIVHAPEIRTPFVTSDAGVITTGTGGAGGGGMGGGGGSGGAGGNGGAGSPDCVGCSFTAAAASGRHLVYDSMRNLIYVSADASAMTNKNSLVTVDPATGSVVSAVPIGMDPGPLAMSDDGSTLWIGIGGEHAIQRVALGTPPVAGTKFTLPTTGTTPLSVAASLTVLPGTTSSVAVAISGTLSVGGPAVYVLDNGVPRAVAVKTSDAVDTFLTRGPPGVLFGFNRFPDFGVLKVTDTGVTQTTYQNLISGNNIRSLSYAGGLVFASDGPVIDVSNVDAPVRAGQFDYLGNAMTLRSTTRLLMLVSNGTRSFTPMLRVLDATTFTSVASAAFPISAVGEIPGLGEMTYIGGDAIAFLSFGTNSYQLEIMHAAVIGSPP